MGVFTDLGKNEMLDASTISYVALFDGNPSSGGTEVSGGSPAYARQSITMTTASGGSIVVTTDAVFDVPSGATINYVAFYATNNTTLLAYDDVTEEVYGGQGTYTLDSSTFSL